MFEHDPAHIDVPHLRSCACVRKIGSRHDILLYVLDPRIYEKHPVLHLNYSAITHHSLHGLHEWRAPADNNDRRIGHLTELDGSSGPDALPKIKMWTS